MCVCVYVQYFEGSLSPSQQEDGRPVPLSTTVVPVGPVIQPPVSIVWCL